VLVPCTWSAQKSPVLAVTAASNGCIETVAVVVTASVGAPAAPNGPTSAEDTYQAP
jgi:hypothetical protein